MGKRNQTKVKQKANRLLLRELQYFGYDIPRSHGQFNNLLPSNLPSKTYVEKIRSFHYFTTLTCLALILIQMNK